MSQAADILQPPGRATCRAADPPGRDHGEVGAGEGRAHWQLDAEVWLRGRDEETGTWVRRS